MKENNNKPILDSFGLSVYSEKNMFESLLKENKELEAHYRFFNKLMPNYDLFSHINESIKIPNVKMDNLTKSTIKQIDMNNINKYLINVNYYKTKSDMTFELRSISKNISFSSNELLSLLDVKDDEFYDGGSSFTEDTISFTNTTEVVINKAEF
ncbi:hypothetical protein MBOVJF4428_00691 [Mycoplasmopsis agalactiae]|uniref:Uncharacterized protein n=1 Tax=Mycoplasmopsis agalactiae (strain NCTC 10123 / CIP 59.7 / PG2) TaxID=347257 RepID=A5IZG7_MYCAP|nr:hypothetical protein [Mycoplasmopsis agalactiae]QYR08869.1 hypothetical protein E5287_03700 [Mycoplasmopsis agalactiae]CAL59426.1 Hypothetical protein MAG7260 [Mycoplasmopsis agalactiae PG2]SBO45646.1 hypothetical protein MBOVJF4428_00691 [Mycoplasmopsis agalactiae]